MTVSFTSPGDDLDSDSPVSLYLIRVSDGDQEILIGETDMAGEHSLSPVPGGEKKEIKIKFVPKSCLIFFLTFCYILRSRSDTFSSNVKYSISMTAIDEAGNESKISNKVTTYKSYATTIHSTHVFVLMMSLLTFNYLPQYFV